MGAHEEAGDHHGQAGTIGRKKMLQGCLMSLWPSIQWSDEQAVTTSRGAGGGVLFPIYRIRRTAWSLKMTPAPLMTLELIGRARGSVCAWLPGLSGPLP
jgi:hypothetical protein